MSVHGDRVRIRLELPRDRMILDRLRRVARATVLPIRGTVLHLAGLFRQRSRRPPVPSRIARLLVLRTDRIGDMALTTPALGDLRACFQKAEITVLAPPGPLEILKEHPAVDRLVPLTGDRLPEDLVGGFDLVIDFTPDETLKGARLARATRAPLRSGFRCAGRQVYFTLRGPRADPRRHIVDLNRDLLETLGVPARTLRPALYLSPAERGQAQARLAALGAASPRVAVHPGGFYPSQRWPPERFAELITTLTERTGAACVVLTGPGETALAGRIRAATTDALCAADLSVRELMALIAACDLFIGNNSGPLHLAAALGLPTVSVMGPSDPLRFAPRGPVDRVLRRDLPCSPCQRASCWHHTCLRSIEPEELLLEAEASLQRRLPREEAQ